ncbi:dolichol kinase [Ignicoccus pacificus DSM 13166]|uniref:Dolichol kinase n=1 Tax=Ignicoccus pacificus DSM 13166 TaxID=940294 RepID=A0A977PKR7_9CREN|nr:dolichol kinase [Ignicoccus pacificus DSM 13166]
MGVMERIIFELLISIPIAIWTLFVMKVLTKKLYHVLRDRGVEHNVAVYYNRKLIHITAGGLVLLVPFLYTEPLVPISLSLILTAIVAKARMEKKKLMYWFQTHENDYEVHFTLMTAVMLALGYLLGNPWYGVLPAAFMAIGDGVTGLIRNALFKRRTKSWYGNIGMLIVNVLIGSLVGLPGIIAGIVAAIVERFEFLGGKIDDNITVPLCSFIVLVLLSRIFNI